LPSDLEVFDVKSDLFGRKGSVVVRSDSFEDVAESLPIPEFTNTTTAAVVEAKPAVEVKEPLMEMTSRIVETPVKAEVIPPVVETPVVAEVVPPVAEVTPTVMETPVVAEITPIVEEITAVTTEEETTTNDNEDTFIVEEITAEVKAEVVAEIKEEITEEVVEQMVVAEVTEEIVAEVKEEEIKVTPEPFVFIKEEEPIVEKNEEKPLPVVQFKLNANNSNKFAEDPFSIRNKTEENVFENVVENKEEEENKIIAKVANDEQMKKAQDRVAKLKELSFKLKSPNGLSELENEPAYKRRNVNLDSTPHSSESQVSRYTLSENEEKKVEIKPNNSFLHDNVD